MFLSQKNSESFNEKENFFYICKLHDLDTYWSNKRCHTTHQKIHKKVESRLTQLSETTMKQEKMYLIRKLERSLSISNPMGRFSANIIGLITKILISKKLIEIY